MYYDDGYLNNGYYDGDLINTVNPSNTVLSVYKSFILDGVDITEFISTFTLTKENNSFTTSLSFELSNFEINTNFVLNKDVYLVVTLGLDVYNFIIIDLEVDYKLKSSVICKTKGVILDLPISSNFQSSTETNSLSIINELLCELNTFIHIPNFLLLEGNYFNEGSILSGLIKMLDVTGSSYRVVNDNIYIMGGLNISTIIPKFKFDILLDKSIVKLSKPENTLNTIMFNTSNLNLYSEPSIQMLYDAKTKPRFLLNPTPKNVSELTSNLGTLVLANTNEIYIDFIAGTNVNLGGGILNITSIKLDGVLISPDLYSYELGYDILIFNEPLFGNIEVIYITKAVIAYSILGVMQGNKDLLFEVKYLNQSISAMIDINISNDINIPDVTTSSLVRGKVTMTYDFDVFVKKGLLSKITVNSTKADDTTIPIERNDWLMTYNISNLDYLSKFTIENDYLVTKTASFNLLDVTNNIPNYTPNIGNSLGFYIFDNIIINDFYIGSKRIEFLTYEFDNYTLYYINTTLTESKVSINYEYYVDKILIPKPFYYENVKVAKYLSYTIVKNWIYAISIASIGVLTTSGLYKHFIYGASYSNGTLVGIDNYTASIGNVPSASLLSHISHTSDIESITIVVDGVTTTTDTNYDYYGNQTVTVTTSSSTTDENDVVTETIIVSKSNNTSTTRTIIQPIDEYNMQNIITTIEVLNDDNVLLEEEVIFIKKDTVLNVVINESISTIINADNTTSTTEYKTISTTNPDNSITEVKTMHTDTTTIVVTTETDVDGGSVKTTKTDADGVITYDVEKQNNTDTTTIIIVNNDGSETETSVSLISVNVVNADGTTSIETRKITTTVIVNDGVVVSKTSKTEVVNTITKKKTDDDDDDDDDNNDDNNNDDNNVSDDDDNVSDDELLNIKDEPDAIPMLKTINIMHLLDMNINDVISRIVVYDGVNYTVNSVGEISINITKREKLEIDTTSILKDSKIIIDASADCGIL